jgi:hypothetical protein
MFRKIDLNNVSIIPAVIVLTFGLVISLSRGLPPSRSPSATHKRAAARVAFPVYQNRRTDYA